ncbi:MAG: nicotinate (nicotinamide) nucleotide adenylyltransferase [Planctomycetota bacterium]
MKKKIVVFGGTFNPIHRAHLRIAGFLLRKFRPDKILFIPCNIPYHKTCEEVIDSRHRMEMVCQVIKHEPRFDISDIEIKRGGKTFSVETMKALKRQYPVGTRFYFVIGTDSLVDLPRWYEINKLIKLCQLITIARPGYPFNKLVQKLPFSAGILKSIKQLYQPNPEINISSTLIRKNIKEHKSIKSLVTVVVEHYIKEHKLYKLRT